MHIPPAVRWLLFGLVMLAASAAFGQIGIAVSFGPPALPIYEQPLCPGDGYLWTPGYWAFDYDENDYYWVPGTWVMAPEVGFLWTPPYWGWGDGGFLFYDGYWGPQVGFYGGIDYGFGYFGEGFVGGRWDRDHFFYNRAVMNVNVTNIRNVYEERVTNVNINNRVSYNGGEGGIRARPTAQQEAAMHERHIPPVAAQTQHVQAARGNPEMRATANHGKPAIAATDRPGDFRGHVVQAKEAGAPYNPPANAGRGRGGNAHESNSGRGNNAPGRTAVHPNDLAPMERPSASNSGNAKQDQKYQKQQDKMYAQQNKERQKLQQQQEKEHQQLEKQNAAQERKQQVEQRHQQQTEQMQQRHTQQREQLQQRQAPRSEPRPPKGK